MTSCNAPLSRRNGALARETGPAACRDATFLLAALPMVLALTTAFAALPVAARDTTNLSGQLTQDQRDWVRNLRSNSGTPCCDDADGIDPEWEIHGSEYRVRFQRRWLVVGPDALLTRRNELGVARAWIAVGDEGSYVRCFLPGSTI